MIGFLLAFVLAQYTREPPPQPPPQQAAPAQVTPPAVISKPPLDYPPERLARGDAADVACLIDIDDLGAVSAATVEKPVAPDFDDAALRFVRGLRFTPALVDGKPAAVRIRFVVHFFVEKKVVPKPAALDAGSVRGEVVEAGSRRPIGGADVLEKEAGLSAVTDAEGRWELRQLAPGEHRISISAAGFDERSYLVRVEPRGEAQAPRAYLHRALVGELSATVAGEKPQEAPTRRTLKHDELVNVPGALNDPVRVVQNLPGLARAPFLSGALLVRGSPAADTGTYLDGTRIPILYHFLGGPSVINEQLLDRIDFYPGGYGAYYGRNLVGAIDVGTRKGDAKALHGSASLDLVEAVGSLEGPVGKNTEVAVAARRSHIDLFLPLFIPNNPDRGATVITPIYWDYQARADHRTDSGDELSLLFFGSDDKLTIIQKGGQKQLPVFVDSHIGFHRALFEYRHLFSDALSLSISPSLGWQTQSFDAAGIGGGTYAAAQGASLTELTAALRAQVTWIASGAVTVRAGTDTQLDRASYSADLQSAQEIRNLGLPITQETRFTRVQPFSQISEYVEAELKLGALKITPGLRSDQIHWRDHTRVVLDPRLWARYALDEKTALKGYVGLYHQPPSGVQIDPSLGNPTLGLESAAQFGLGVEHRFSDVWNASAEVFYNRRYGLVQRVDPIALANGTVYNPKYENNAIGRSFGLELLIRREITSRLYGWLAYTLSKSEVLHNPGDQWTAFTYDQPHILTAVLGYRPLPGWELSTRFRFTSGNPTAPVLYATFDADTGSYTATRGRFGDARLPSFAQLDGRAQRTWTWDTWELSAYLDVQNLTNHKNEELHVYDYRFRDQGGISGIPILPTLGVKARF